MWYLYICNKTGNLYTGITTDLGNRMRQHRHAELLLTEEYQDKKDTANLLFSPAKNNSKISQKQPACLGIKQFTFSQSPKTQFLAL
jgi:predicted GIY-YIG superfamily endonuclease